MCLSIFEGKARKIMTLIYPPAAVPEVQVVSK